MNSNMRSCLIFVLGLTFHLVSGQNTTESPTTACGDFKVYKDCGSACPPSCSTSNPTNECIEECIKGCFCIDGYVEDVSRNCITLDLCKSCTGNTTFTSCSYEQPQICGEEKEPQSEFEKVKCYIGCICKSGYVRLSADQLTCVLPEDCPSTKATP
ncbi:venom peptide SjAPI-like [Xenopus laevis]|uniref:Venom peptide SjAPI-like n=1 Tax=Xenopus laevis TaxID=8355 RepID=A0A8J1LF79_XENLA|nr:venom peptide SjAPI-like [Xenopus laevis]